MDWARLLAYITGTVDQELLLRNEYLVAENRILKAQIKTRLQLSDAERATLAEIGHRPGRKVCLAGMTPHPDEEWMKQMARNVTKEQWGFLGNCRYLLHDRDGKFCLSFDEIIESGKVKPISLPARSPNLNCYAERWVRSVKEDCLSRLILFGQSSLKRALQQYQVHYHEERNHQGKDNRLLFPRQTPPARRAQQPVQFQQRLGGLLKYCYRKAA
jgi:putative transposase